MNILYNNFYNFTDYPFKHCCYKLLSDDLCKELIENLYTIKEHLKKSKGLSQSRFKLDLLGNNIDGINFENKDYLKNIEPLFSFLNELGKSTSKKLYEKYNSNKKSIIHFKIMLVLDNKKYSIGPHTDSYNRNSTLVTYLVPEKDKTKNLGLCVYKDKINRHKFKWLKTHYSFDNFEKIKQIEYYPGSTIDFKVSPNSFHGVEEIKDDCDRMSIQMFVFNK